MKLNPSTTGAYHELKVSLDLISKGYEVFRALSPSCSCDLIALKNGKSLRVEVTTGAFQALRQGNTLYWAKHDPKKYDLLVVVADSNIYYMPELEE